MKFDFVKCEFSLVWLLICRHSDEIELNPLAKQSDVETIYSAWPMADRNSPQVLLRAAKYSPSVGAFAKDGSLVAWIFR